ncbi:MAG: methyl-accepting chemotaxis protein [Paraglaciecola sp.]|nr:methyl-accepting chemotaxis protein [Paraglaciecola sp.]NCT47590.1 methyl-accepting chemotaxis protein [Paraglaciecola sp.]
MLSLSHKNYLVSGLFLLVLMGQSILIHSNMTDINQSIQYDVETLQPISKAVTELRFDIIQVQQWLTDISATRALNGLNDGFDEAEKFAKDARQQLQLLEQALPEQRNTINRINSRFNDYYQTGKAMAQSYVADGPSAGNQLMDGFDRASQGLQDEVTELVKATNAMAKASQQAVQASASAGTSTANLTFVLFILMIAGLVWFTQVFVMQPIKRLQKVFEKLNEGKANLNYRFKAPSNDEIGRIQSEFNEFMDKVKQLADELNRSAMEVYRNIETLMGYSANTSEELDSQLRLVDNLASAMTEMSQTSVGVANNSQQLSTQVSDINQHLSSGYQLATKTQLATSNVAEKIQVSANVIDQLEEHAKKIATMVDNIESIAEQTNLLALNAAIEAARAGEQGRGFSVVADEVRSLASRTQQSTVEIKGIIQTLQSTSQHAVSEMNLCRDEVSSCVNHAKDSQNSLASLQTIVKTIDDMSHQIATAMEQQSQTVEHHTLSLNGIVDASKQVKQHANQTHKSVDLLQVQAEQLTGLAKTFGS